MLQKKEDRMKEVRKGMLFVLCLGVIFCSSVGYSMQREAHEKRRENIIMRAPVKGCCGCLKRFFTRHCRSGRKYRNIIFDLGGVMYDVRAALFSFFHGNIGQASRYAPYLAHEYWTDSFQGKSTFAQDAAKLNVSKFMRDVFVMLYKRLHDVMPVHKKVLEIFYELKIRGYRIYFLSNLQEELYQRLEKRDEFFACANGVVVSGVVGMSKPNRDIYDYLLTTYKLNPEECLFIDDSRENIVRGNMLGIDGIVCQNQDMLGQTLQSIMVLH